jgi:hypothetical protein
MAVFVTAFLVANIANLLSAYGCTNSTNTNHANSSSVVNGSSSVSTKQSASTGSSQISTMYVALKIPVGQGPCGVAKVPNTPVGGVYMTPSHSAK